MAKKKRIGRGRPTNVQRTVLKGFRYNESTVEVLASLTNQFKAVAPPYMQISQRVIIEALVHYAVRENLSFAELFQVPQGAAK